MSIQPTQPQSIGGVLDTTFQLYKASIVKMIGLSVLMSLAESPSSIYLFTQGGAATSTNPYAVLELMSSGTFWLIIVVQVVLSTWTMAAGYLKLGAIGAGGDLALGTALQKALTRLPVLIVMMLLFGIAVTIGLVLLLVPGFILMVSLGLCYNTALFENRGPVEALSESHRLVWGNWWRTAAILTVGFIIIFVMYMVAGLITGVLTPILVLGGGSENVLLLSTISGWLIGLFINVLVMPFYIALPISVYWDVKLRKDGGDLAARVGALNPA